MNSSDEPATGQTWHSRLVWVAAAWHSFGEWRRCRPFWGGLLLALAGLELIAIPLSSVLARSSIKLVIYIGIGGVAGVIIGVLLIACSVLIWLQPAHRLFYSIAGVMLAVASFIATNLGGFFVGMLLGVVGGSLSFGWTPTPDERRRGRRPETGTSIKLLAQTAPLVLLGLGLPAHGASATAAHPQPSCILPIPILCPSPTPSPLPTPSLPVPTPSLPVPVPSASVGPVVSVPGAPGLSPSPHPRRKGRKASAIKAAAPRLEVSSARFSLVTGAALLTGSAYQGVAHVPVSGGGTVVMMKFSMSSLTLTGSPTLTVRQDGQTSSASATSMRFTGNVVLYATRLSGDLAGVPITVTPNSPLSLVLKLLGSVTQRVQLRLSSVTTDQPYVSTDALAIGALKSATPG